MMKNLHIEVKLGKLETTAKNPLHNAVYLKWDDLAIAAERPLGRMPRRLTARIVSVNAREFAPRCGRQPLEKLPRARKSWLMEMDRKEDLWEALRHMENQAHSQARRVISRHIGVFVPI